jgi:hypothetical protein
VHFLAVHGKTATYKVAERAYPLINPPKPAFIKAELILSYYFLVLAVGQLQQIPNWLERL